MLKARAPLRGGGGCTIVYCMSKNFSGAWFRVRIRGSKIIDQPRGRIVISTYIAVLEFVGPEPPQFVVYLVDKKKYNLKERGSQNYNCLDSALDQPLNHSTLNM